MLPQAIGADSDLLMRNFRASSPNRRSDSLFFALLSALVALLPRLLDRLLVGNYETDPQAARTLRSPNNTLLVGFLLSRLPLCIPLGSGGLTLEDADLLPQGDELQSEVMSRAEEGTEPRKKSQEKPGHGPSLRDSVDRSQIPVSC